MKSLNKNKSNKSTLLWIYRRVKHFIPHIIVICLAAILDALVFIALAMLSKNLIDIATKAKSGSLITAAVMIFAVVIAHIIFTGVRSTLKTYTITKTTMSIRNHLFSTISKKKYANISQYHSGDLLNRMTSDTDVVVLAVCNVLPTVAAMMSKLVGGLSALLILDWKITAIVLCLGLFVPAVGRVLSKKYKYLHKQNQHTEGNTRAFLQECFENLVVVKTFAKEAPFSKKLNRLMHYNFLVKMKMAVISLLTHLSMYSFFTAGYYIMMVWGASQISAGVITYGTLTAFLQLISQLRSPLQEASGILPQYYSALASAERLMELEEIEDDLPSVDDEKLCEIKNNFSGMDVKDISFAYKDELILKNCSFTAEKGKITAITGESGSGKSTIFRVILGLYNPQEGEILINGDIKLDTSLRGLFAYVPQGNLVLSGTIRENLTLCNDDVSDDELIKATKAADIYDLIASLPEGFDTVVTERGGGLSEGQIQRISIARALLTDAPILLLDEATSALDESTETTVLSNIKAMKEKTILFVTHRNTSLRVCDKIIRVEDKKFNVIKE